MLNKPAYVGICILELSKVIICELHYEYKDVLLDKKRVKIVNE